VSAIVVGIPREWYLNANQRFHWRKKANRAAFQRASACGAGRAYVRAQGTLDGRQKCIVTIDWPDRRRRDADNLTLKHVIDGLVDARVLVDDSDKYLIGPDRRVSDQLCDKRYAAVLYITFEAAS
jgi:Holliday junction resolvase RusA-like endonuclease